MSSIYYKLIDYLSYSFVQYAFIVGILIALCASLLGVTLVLRRFSFIGDGLAHVAFGAMAIAAVLNISNDMPFIMAVTIISAVLLLRTGQNSKIKGDAAIAMISVAALAIGYLLMNVFSTKSNVSGDVCTTLFGAASILTLSKAELWTCVISAGAVVAIFIFMYNRIFTVTFDEDFSKAVGTNTERYNLMMAVIIAVIIVMGMSLVGTLLITALIVFPALSAMMVARSFRMVTVLSALIGVICCFIGITTSILAGTPVGATIVVIDIVAFCIFYGINVLKNK